MKTRATSFPILTVIALCIVAIAVATDDVSTHALILAVGLAVYFDRVRSQLDKHQKALEWFTDHIYFHGTPKDSDAPDEILDILGKED